MVSCSPPSGFRHKMEQSTAQTQQILRLQRGASNRTGWPLARSRAQVHAGSGGTRCRHRAMRRTLRGPPGAASGGTGRLPPLVPDTELDDSPCTWTRAIARTVCAVDGTAASGGFGGMLTDEEGPGVITGWREPGGGAVATVERRRREINADSTQRHFFQPANTRFSPYRISHRAASQMAGGNGEG